MKTINYFLLAAISFLFFFACIKTNVQDENNTVRGPLTSVSIENGKYKVDSMIIWRYNTKERLIKDVDAKKLIDKKTLQEIPEFIIAFLNDISPKGKFEMVNPGKDFYYNDITAFAHLSNNKLSAQEIPNRQLVYFGIDDNTAILSYYCGGLSVSQPYYSGGLGVRQCTSIIKFKAGKITDFWYGNTDFALSKQKIVYDLREKKSGGC